MSDAVVPGAASSAAAPASPSSAPASVSTPSGSESSAAGSQASSGGEPNGFPTDAKPQTPAQTLKQKIKGTVDGEDFEEEIDFSDIAGLTKKIQLAKVAQKRMQETADLKKQTQTLQQRIKDNPFEVLKELGLDTEEAATRYLWESKLQFESMTPEQRELYDAKQKLSAFEKREAQVKAEQEAAKEAELRKTIGADFDRQISAALTEVDIPKNPRTVRKMIKLMQMNLDKGLDLSPKEVAEVVRDNYKSDIQHFFGSNDGDKLYDILGEENIAKVQKAAYARYKAKQSNPKPLETNPVINPASQKSAEPKKGMTADEMKEWIRRGGR